MFFDSLEFIEAAFVFKDDDGGVLFSGTPDHVRITPDANTRICTDWKMGRIAVQPAEINLQLRCYLTSDPAPDGFVPEDHQAFRPSNILRRKACPGSLSLESTLPEPPSDYDGGKYAEEGTMLHAHLADRTKPRDGLNPEQFETLEKAEAMEAEFVDIVKKQMKPGWGFGAIIQPRIANKPFIVAYSPEDIEASRREIIALWHEAHKPDAPRVASADACRYCRATSICEEHKSWIMGVEKIAHLPAYSWTPDQWDLFLTRKSALTKFIDERYEEAKAIKAADPDKIPGWELRDGHERRIITDVVQAWSRLSGKMSAQSFSQCCEVSIGDLERAIWQASQGAKDKLSQKAVKVLLNAILEGIIDRKRNKPSLVKADL